MQCGKQPSPAILNKALAQDKLAQYGLVRPAKQTSPKGSWEDGATIQGLRGAWVNGPPATVAAKEKQLAAKEKRLAAREQQIAATEKALEKAESSTGTAEGEQDPEIAKQLTQVKARIKFLDGIPEEHRELFPGLDGMLAAKRAEAKALGEQLRASKPLDIRLKKAQEHLKACQGRHDRHRATLAAREAALEEAKQSVHDMQTRVAEAQTSLDSAKAEFAAVTAQAAAHTLGGDSAAPTPASAMSLQHISLLENIVSLVPREVFQKAVGKAGGNAEELEQATAAILASLRASVPAAATAPSVSSGAPATPSGNMEVELDEEDYAALEGLGLEASPATSEEDKVERKRKAGEFLRKQREVIKNIGKKGKGKA